MLATVFSGESNISLEKVPDPEIKEPTDAIVEIEVAGVCGSDLWTYRGQSTTQPGARIGHEFVGRVIEVGAAVGDVTPGDWVIAPFRYSCGHCAYCKRGLTSSCVTGGFWSRDVLDAGQGEYARVPLADGTLVRPLPSGERPDSTLVPDLLALTDVMVTGLHAARSARMQAGCTVCVIGDGAVGICAVLAARFLGAERIVVLGSSHSVRRDLALRAGADEVFSVRGGAAVEQVKEITHGGADAVLECVGTAQSFATAMDVAADGAAVGYVGLPHGVSVDPARMFARNLTLAGGVCPARALIPKLIPAVLRGSLNPGIVFDARYPLESISMAYDDLDHRRCVKPLIDVRKEKSGSDTGDNSLSTTEVTQ